MSSELARSAPEGQVPVVKVLCLWAHRRRGRGGGVEVAARGQGPRKRLLRRGQCDQRVLIEIRKKKVKNPQITK